MNITILSVNTSKAETYITKVKEKDHGEEAVTVDVKSVHRFNLVNVKVTVRIRLLFFQVLVCNEAHKRSHNKTPKQKMERDEA